MFPAENLRPIQDDRPLRKLWPRRTGGPANPAGRRQTRETDQRRTKGKLAGGDENKRKKTIEPRATTGTK